MEETEITIGDKTFVVRELLAIEFDEISDSEDVTKRIVQIIKKCADMKDDDYAKLTIRERSKLMEEINKINGWVEDFQNTQEEE